MDKVKIKKAEILQREGLEALRFHVNELINNPESCMEDYTIAKIEISFCMFLEAQRLKLEIKKGEF